MKIQIIYLAICSLSSQAVYVSRMSAISRMRMPTPFRPGVNLRPEQQRHWNHPRLVQAASHRAPYVLYRSPPHHRYIKHPSTVQATRTYTVNSGPWKTTPRLPFSPSTQTQEYEFVRSASHPTRVHTNGGAIHTIPAPNLSLSEKPIVVLDSDNGGAPAYSHHRGATSEVPKPTYEVTEKFIDPMSYKMATKIVETMPAGFSQHNSLPEHDLNTYIRNGAALQVASELGLSAITITPQPAPIVQQRPVPFELQGFHGVQHPHELMRHGLEGIIIQPNPLMQSDPTFLQKIQTQLLQSFPAVEFVPYNADLQPQVSTQSQVFLFGNEDNQVNQQQHQILSVLPLQKEQQDFENHKNVVRETQEGNYVTVIPQHPTANHTENEIQNSTENIVEVITVTKPDNQSVTIELVAAETQTGPSTVKYVLEGSTVTNEKSNLENENQNTTTPIYYAQVGQSVGNVVASGFYSAINDVRAAAALAQVETPKPEEAKKMENSTAAVTTTINPDLKQYFVQNVAKEDNNHTMKPLLGVPFGMPDSVKVAYTLLRADDKDAKVTQDGTVYAGQIVEASISEDQDFNKEKADLLSRKPLIRLVTVTESKETQSQTTTTTSTTPAPKITVVKAKIPPRSKLTFDDKTGEPILRIYASYVDSPLQKEIMTSKLTNMKHVKEVMVKKQDSTVDNWKAGSVKALDKDQSGSDANKVMQFGLKLKDRLDDITPIFVENED